MPPPRQLRRICTLAPLAAGLLAAGCGTGQPSEPMASAPAAASRESDFLARIVQVTFEGRRAGEGYYSPDGRRLVFQSEREPGNPFYQIYETDLDAGTTRRVSPGMGKTTCAFIQPGTGDILFASTHHDPKSVEYQQQELELRAAGKERRYSWDYDPEFEIYLADSSTGELRRLTDVRGYDAEGSFSPDGRRIVFSSMREAYTRALDTEEQRLLETNPAYFGDIYIMNADGSDQRRLTDAPGYDGGPFFSPRGDRIVWRRFDKEGLIADIWTMRTDGTDPRQITDFQSMSWAPYYHPSQDYIFFASNKFGFSNFEIFIVDAEGRHEPVRITDTDGFDGLPVPSPDGTRLTFTSSRKKGGGQLFTGLWNDDAARRALDTSPLRPQTPD